MFRIWSLAGQFHRMAESIKATFKKVIARANLYNIIRGICLPVSSWTVIANQSLPSILHCFSKNFWKLYSLSAYVIYIMTIWLIGNKQNNTALGRFLNYMLRFSTAKCKPYRRYRAKHKYIKSNFIGNKIHIPDADKFIFTHKQTFSLITLVLRRFLCMRNKDEPIVDSIA